MGGGSSKPRQAKPIGSQAKGKRVAKPVGSQKTGGSPAKSKGGDRSKSQDDTTGKVFSNENAVQKSKKKPKSPTQPDPAIVRERQGSLYDASKGEVKGLAAQELNENDKATAFMF